MMKQAIVLTKGTRREYLTVGPDGDEIQNARQAVDLSNDTSVLDFDLEKKSHKWDYFEGEGLEVEARGRLYCIWGEDTITKSRDNDGTHLHVKLKETWYKLSKIYLTAYNIDVETSPDFDHIDQHMVVLLGNSPDQLYINGNKVTCPYPVGTSKYLFWCVLYGTGWTLDTRYDAYWPDGKFDLETDKASRLDNLKKIKEFFGGMLFWDSKNKRYALVDENKYQVYEGFDIRYRKNLISIERREDRNVITRLYVYGNGNLNIAAVNGGKEYIDNFAYTAEIREDIITNNDIYTQDSLLTWGKRESAFYAKPRQTYSVDILKYESEQGKAIPQPDIGKLGKLYDEEVVGVPTLQRILKTDQNVFVEHDCKVVVGDIIRTFERKLVDMGEDAGKAGDAISGTGEIPGITVRGETRVEKAIRIELVSVDGNLRTLISATAEGIRTEVSNIEAGLYTTISQTARDIRLEAVNMENRLSTSITLTAEAITTLATSVDGRFSEVTQTVDEVVTEIGNARGEYATLSLRVNAITQSVGSLDGRFTTVEQTVGNIKSTVYDPLTGLSVVRQTANDVTTEVVNARGGYSKLYQRFDYIVSAVFDRYGYSKIEQTASKVAIIADVYGNVNSASIIAAINRDYSSVKISADRVSISGVVTFNDLKNDNSTTIINGANIRTGTISADRLSAITVTADNIRWTNAYGSTARVDKGYFKEIDINSIAYVKYLNLATTSGGHVRVRSKRLSNVTTSDWVLTAGSETSY